MNRDLQTIDLGRASVVTKGVGILYADVVGKQDEPGLNLA